MTWDPRAVPAQDGLTAVITGGNAGIGYHVAEQLARAGARVVLAGRSAERTRTALYALRAAVPGAWATDVRLDLADLDSVRRAAEQLAAAGPVDLLVNNAGVTASGKRAETAQGFELMFGTNHLGHFALTLLLAPALGTDARVVSLGSLTHTRARLDFDDLQSRTGYRSMAAYGRSKLAVLLFAAELDRRLRASGSTVRSVAAHPGWAVQGLTPARPPLWEPGLLTAARCAPLALLAQGKDRGAWPVVRAATDPEARGGQYFGPIGPGSLKGLPSLRTMAGSAHDPQDAARLWTVSEELTGTRWTG
ncbi:MULTISPECIES: oxidoreductase [unclassified Streptomyces]|uniref:oxidoreductase n=1 Tax=unclassified Streptomyces TaxID=2593676 RepID=UPI0004CB3380|nr:oxidoreductase [Streptomyces sp. NRRL F-2747]